MVLAMLVPIFTSSDDDLDEVETAWTEVLERIDDRPFALPSMPSESDESFDGFSDVGSDIHVNVNNYSDVS